MNLSVPLGNLVIKNPILVASGTYGLGKEANSLIDLDKLGAFVSKTITKEVREGNPPPRICETACGLLNSIGLENPGIDAYLSKEIRFFDQLSVPLILSIAGQSVEDFCLLAQRLNDEKRVQGIEANISCPNVKEGMIFGQDPELTFTLVRALRQSFSRTLIVKLTPNTPQITEVALAAQEAGADCLSLVNTFLGMSIDWKTRRSRLGTLTGGLSGPAIKPLALRLVWEVYQKVNIPLIGMGGITSGEDALEFILAGASAVAVGSASFRWYNAPLMILEELESLLSSLHVENIKEIKGGLIYD